jgi:5-methylcytosine-specific restriction endonuclease McrA
MNDHLRKLEKEYIKTMFGEEELEKLIKIKKEQFLEHAVLHSKSYNEIEKILEIPRSEFSPWWEELKTERLYLSNIRKIWKSKFKNEELDINTFKKWYEQTEKKCFYCNLTDEDNKQLWLKHSDLTKRNRGRSFEIDRKEPNEKYENIGNLVYSCYWCNNAKTDTFTANEFKVIIGPAIEAVWKQRLLK